MGKESKKKQHTQIRAASQRKENYHITTGVIVLRQSGPDSTFFIVVVVCKMQQMPILMEAHTEAVKVFPPRLLVTQHSFEPFAITRGLRTL